MAKTKGDKKKTKKVLRHKRVQIAQEKAQSTIAKNRQEKESSVKPTESIQNVNE